MNPADDAEPPPHPMDAAMEAYRRRFGAYPGTFGLEGVGRDAELMQLVLEATATGVPLDIAVLREAWGKTVPPEANS